MTWTLGKECCVCHGYMDPVQVRKNPGMEITHGLCSTCAPKWHAEQLADVADMLKRHLKEKEVTNE